MASIPFIATTASSLTVLAVGSAANIAASLNKPLESKTWSKSGGFIGLTNGRTAVAEAPSAPAAAPPASTPKTSGDTPIGGATDLPAPPTPFGRFKKCRPTKLPGPPKPYDPSNSP